jgi:hypothetical protein
LIAVPKQTYAQIARPDPMPQYKVAALDEEFARYVSEEGKRKLSSDWWDKLTPGEQWTSLFNWNANKGWRYHGCGNVNRIFGDFIEIGVDAVNPLEAKAGLDVVELRRQYGHKIAFCGNMDVLTWALGSEEELRRVVLTKLNAAKGGGFIFQSDHSVPGNVPARNYEYVVNLVREHGRYPLRLGEYDQPHLK